MNTNPANSFAALASASAPIVSSTRAMPDVPMHGAPHPHQGQHQQVWNNQPGGYSMPTMPHAPAAHAENPAFGNFSSNQHGNLLQMSPVSGYGAGCHPAQGWPNPANGFAVPGGINGLVLGGLQHGAQHNLLVSEISRRMQESVFTNTGDTMKELTTIFACWEIPGYCLTSLEEIKQKYTSDKSLMTYAVLNFDEWKEKQVQILETIDKALALANSLPDKVTDEAIEAEKSILDLLGSPTQHNLVGIQRANQCSSIVAQAARVVAERARYDYQAVNQRHTTLEYAEYVQMMTEKNKWIADAQAHAKAAEEKVAFYESLLYPATEKGETV